MPIEFNHTIVAAHDQRKSAEFVSELFGLPSPKPFGHFLTVALEHGATLDYADVAAGEEIRPQHYAFLEYCSRAVCVGELRLKTAAMPMEGIFLASDL